jgi:hypothetical protein
MANGLTKSTEVGRIPFVLNLLSNIVHLCVESVTEPEILAILKPMIKRYALERLTENTLAIS